MSFYNSMYYKNWEINVFIILNWYKFDEILISFEYEKNIVCGVLSSSFKIILSSENCEK